MSNEQRYKEFLKNPSWNARFVWTGLLGNGTRSTLSIMNYNKETSNLKNLQFNNTLSFYKQIKGQSELYKDWCSKKDKKLSVKELESLQLFFIGCIGEFFFVKMFEHKNNILINGRMYTFYDICPRLTTDWDFGVDLTGRVNTSLNETYDCALQVKFWSPFANESFIDNKIAQSLHSDAVVNEMIDVKQKNNLFICWLGDMKNVSRWLQMKENKLNEHIVFIDQDVLRKHIDGDAIFWEKINLDISNI